MGGGKTQKSNPDKHNINSPQSGKPNANINRSPMKIGNKCKVYIIDSYGEYHHNIANSLRRWIQINNKNMQVEIKHSTKTQQMDNFNCGLYAWKNIQYICRCITMNKKFKIEDIPTLDTNKMHTLRRQIFDYMKHSPIDTYKEGIDRIEVIASNSYKTIVGVNWLDDKILQYLLDHHTYHPQETTITNTFFLPIIIEKMRKLRYNSENIIIPMHVLGNHWIVSYIKLSNKNEIGKIPRTLSVPIKIRNLEAMVERMITRNRKVGGGKTHRGKTETQCTIMLIDSLGRRNPGVIKHITKWISKIYGLQNIITEENTQKVQNDSYNCGLFTWSFLHWIINERNNGTIPTLNDISPTTANLDRMRKLLYKKILADKTATGPRLEDWKILIKSNSHNSLLNNNWINDAALLYINKYYAPNNKNVYKADPLFYNSIVKRIRDWKGRDSRDILLPVNLNNSHWILAYITFQQTNKDNPIDSHQDKELLCPKKNQNTIPSIKLKHPHNSHNNQNPPQSDKNQSRRTLIEITDPQEIDHINQRQELPHLKKIQDIPTLTKPKNVLITNQLHQNPELTQPNETLDPKTPNKMLDPQNANLAQQKQELPPQKPKTPTDNYKPRQIKRDTISILSHNINGKYKKATEGLDELTRERNIDIICWQETRTTDESIRKDSCPALTERYEMIHRPLTEEEKEEKRRINKTTSHTNSEGLAIFIKEDLMPNLVILEINRRYIAIAIRIQPKAHLLVVNVYAPVDRKDNDNYWSILEDKLKEWKTKLRGKTEITIVGDFNVTIHKHQAANPDSYMARFINSNSKQIKLLMNNLNLSIAISSNKKFSFNKFTNTDKNRGWYRASLDHILVNEFAVPRIIKAKYLDNTHIKSDHLAAYIEMNIDINLLREIKRMRANENNKNLRFRTELIKRGTTNQNETLNKLQDKLKSINTTDKSIEEIEQQIQEVVKQTLGMKGRTNYKKKWIYSHPKLNTIKDVKNKTLIALKTKQPAKAKLYKDIIIRKMKNNPKLFKGCITLAQEKNTLRELKGQLKNCQKAMTRKIKSKTIKLRIKRNLQDMVHNQKQFNKRLFKEYAKEHIGIYDKQGLITTNKQECIQIVGEWWKNLYNRPTVKPTRMPQALQEYYTNLTSSKQIQPLRKISKKEYLERLGKRFVAPGKSGISAEIIQNLPNHVLEKFVETRNKIILEGTPIPQQWRINPICLLPKNSKQFKKPGEFRPITLLDNQYRGLAHDVWIRIKQHIENNNIINENQIGSIKGKSTADHILTIKSIIDDANKRKKKVYLALIDLIKAYDSVQHWAIKQTLHKYGVDKETIQVVMDMHKGLLTTIEINGLTSQPFPMNNGIRQGDVLAPLLFILVINPIIDIISKKCKGYRSIWTKIKVSILAYMDDIILVSDELEDFQNMCKLLTEIIEYLSLKINEEKTYILTNDTTIALINIGGHHIKPLPKGTPLEYLGYFISLDNSDQKNDATEANNTIAKLNKLTNKKIPIETKVKIINKIILKTPEYKWNFHMPKHKTIIKITQAIERCIKHSIPMNTFSTNDFIWRPKNKGGLGVIHPRTTANQALLSTFQRVCSKKSLAANFMHIAVINNTNTHHPNNPIYTRDKMEKWTKPNKKIIPDNYIEQVNQAARNNNMYIYNRYQVLGDSEFSKTLENEEQKDSREESLKEEPFRNRYNLRKKGKHPYKFNPRKIPAIDEIVETLEGEIIIWTDGSARKETPTTTLEFTTPEYSTAFSTFYKEASSLNRAKRCIYATNSFEAELEAIEYTLNKAPTEKNIIIISDCEAAIKAIKKGQDEKSGAVKRINKLIKKRQNMESQTKLKHIIAHTDNEKIPEKRKRKIQEYKEMYKAIMQPNIDPFQGNIQADKLANGALEQRTSWLFNKKRTQIRAHQTLSIRSTKTKMAAEIKIECLKEQHREWETKRARKEPTNKEILEITYQTLLKDNPNYTKIIKLQSLALAGKKQAYYNLKAKTCPTWVTQDKWERYKDKTCEFCTLRKDEDTIHILGECPYWEGYRIELREKIDQLFKDHSLIPPETLWLTKDDDYTDCRSENAKKRHNWLNKNKLYVSTGKIPHRTLIEMYEESNISSQEWKEIFEGMAKTIINTMTNLTKQRNKEWKEKFTKPKEGDG